MNNFCSAVVLGCILILAACGGGTETGTPAPAAPAPAAPPPAAPPPTTPAPSAACTATILTAEVSSNLFVQTQATNFNPSANNGDTTLCQGFVNNTEVFSSNEVINGDVASCGGLRTASVQAGDTFKVQYTWQGATCSASTGVNPDPTPPAPAATLRCSGDRPPGSTIPANQQTVATVTLSNGFATTANYILSCNGVPIEAGTRPLSASGQGTFSLIPVNEACDDPGDGVSIQWSAQGLTTTCTWTIQ